jgi:hypothetical protein
VLKAEYKVFDWLLPPEVCTTLLPCRIQ